VPLLATQSMWPRTTVNDPTREQRQEARTKPVADAPPGLSISLVSQ
jgi:hypothetical protein